MRETQLSSTARTSRCLEQKRLDINGRLCEGTFTIQARVETDLLLSLTDDGCRIEVLGSHREGDAHVDELDGR